MPPVVLEPPPTPWYLHFKSSSPSAMGEYWTARLGVLRRQRPELPLYWLLLVKGHRTFRYLPLFSKSFHPHWSMQRGDLKSLADSLAQSMFPDDYNPATGVVELKKSRGHLK